jgi:hypothetical protein
MAIAHWGHPSNRPTRAVHPTLPGRPSPLAGDPARGPRRLGRRWHCRQMIARLSNPRVPTPAAHAVLAEASLAASDLTFTMSAVRQPGIMSTNKPALPIPPSEVDAPPPASICATPDPSGNKRPPPVDEPCLKRGCRLPCRPLPRGRARSLARRRLAGLTQRCGGADERRGDWAARQLGWACCRTATRGGEKCDGRLACG